MVLDIIDYGKLVDEAMHLIVYKVLKIVQEYGLPGNHHFFISFITKHPEVKLSPTLSAKHPREMTVVLQYQFQDLNVDSKGFWVTLSFNGNIEKIYIPFNAITTFADPSVQFGLQFREAGYSYNEEINVELSEPTETKKKPSKNDVSKPAGKDKQTKGNKDRSPNKKDIPDNVVQLDKFRRKP